MIQSEIQPKRITLRDVAEEAGVSKTTAVFVLNNRPGFSVSEETRRRVESAARRLGYRRNGLAAALSHGTTGSVGLLLQASDVDRRAEVGDEFLLGNILAATRATDSASLRLTTIAISPTNSPTPAEVTDFRVDGLMLLALRDEEFARAIYETGFPCVTLGSGYGPRRVSADNFQGGRLAAEHLIALGHRRIAYAGLEGNLASAERYRGLATTMAEQGLQPALLTGSSESVMRQIIAEPESPITAVFCFNDARAAYIVKSARALGLSVPQDLSIVGFDNCVLADALGLTTINYPMSECADVAVQMLLRLRQREAVTSPAPIPTYLEVRNTTAPPRTHTTSFLIANSHSFPMEVS